VSEIMRRREFITLLGGAAAVSSVTWPLAAAQAFDDRPRRIAYLSGGSRAGTDNFRHSQPIDTPDHAVDHYVHVAVRRSPYVAAIMALLLGWLFGRFGERNQRACRTS
jgi:hypothetical protein